MNDFYTVTVSISRTVSASSPEEAEADVIDALDSFLNTYSIGTLATTIQTSLVKEPSHE